MARKKDKIVVNLDLPKDDTTMTKLYVILFFSIILGLGSGLFWISNSGFVPTANGEPMFTNLYCGATAQDELGNPTGEYFQTNQKPTYTANQTCSILQDRPDRITWEDEEWTMVTKRGKNFDVPGVPASATGGSAVFQPLWLNYTVEALLTTITSSPFVHRTATCSGPKTGRPTAVRSNSSSKPFLPTPATNWSS